MRCGARESIYWPENKSRHHKHLLHSSVEHGPLRPKTIKFHCAGCQMFHTKSYKLQSDNIKLYFTNDLMHVQLPTWGQMNKYLSIVWLSVARFGLNTFTSVWKLLSTIALGPKSSGSTHQFSYDVLTRDARIRPNRRV